MRRKHSTALAIQGDVALMSLLRDWCRGHADSNGSNTGHRLDNMRCERKLANFRRAMRHMLTRPNVKRIMTHGYLDELGTVHRLCGGDDPRALTRSRVAALGIHTQRQETQMKEGKSHCPGHIRYISAVEHDRGGEHSMPRQQFLAERKKLAAEFKDLAPEEKARFTHAKDVCDPDIDIDTGSYSAVERYKKRVGQQLWGCSDHFNPIRPDIIEREMCKHAEVDVHLMEANPCFFV